MTARIGAILVFLAVSGTAELTTSLPLSVLQDREVRLQLDSGLTTTFLVVAREANKPIGGARIEIRYDLWDEVYVVRKLDFDRKEERQRLPSLDALERWWRSAVVRLAADRSGHDPLQGELTVLPFSPAEQEDARQWLAKSGGVGRAATGATSSTLVDALIGTTLHAKAIHTYRWLIQ